MARRRYVNVWIADGAGAEPFMDNMVAFVFDRKNSKTMRSCVVDLGFAEKLAIAIQSICITSYYECMRDHQDQGNDSEAECRRKLKDCLSSQDSFAEHARLVYSRFIEKTGEEK